jgi:serine/threonine protein kinase/tetratricopeptide (TPR) repeat protein
MPDPGPDRQLLFGLLALQVGLIDQGQLVAAFQAWTRDKAKTLAEYLTQRGILDTEERAGIEVMVELHLKKHGGSSDNSLAVIPASLCTRESLALLGDADIAGSLACLGCGNAQEDGDADRGRTVSYSVVTSTDDGRRYRILRPHARGGLGAVFVALDQELHREVALKQILDQHADDPQSRQRFLLEAEVTGGLEHPGIVPVYGLGTYADGRPFYAMRFIRGDSLKGAIEQFHAEPALERNPGHRSLELRKLLGRFVDVCNAIEYAHSRGVLHRDIKPSNIIIGKHGETLVVDWGLAKALGRAEPGSDPAERTLVPPSASGSASTVPGSALGTPAYMSPEQSEGDLKRVGPRSDVYSLGATLYCLLTGKPPFEGDLAQVIADVQEARFPAPRQLDPEIDRALEAVCKKAMARMPADRYGSPRALCDDVERWMADEPVGAWREPWTRTVTRWLTRHRVGVTAAAAAVLVALVGTGAVLGVQATANAELKRANTRERAAAEIARRAQATAQQEAETAKTEAAISRAVNDFLNRDLLAQASPDLTADRDLKLRTVLERASQRIEHRFQDQPLVEAAIRTTLGDTYFDLGDYPPAERHCRRAAELYRQTLGPDDSRTLAARYRVAAVLDREGRLKEARALHEEVLETRRRVLGVDDPATFSSMGGLAQTLRDLGWLKEARALYEQVLEHRRRVLGPEDPDTLRTMNNLAGVYSALGLLVESGKLHEQVLDARRRIMPPEHPDLLMAMDNMAIVLSHRGRLDEARKLHEEVLAIRRRVLTPEHPDTLASMSNLASVLRDLGRDPVRAQVVRDPGLLEESRKLDEETLRIRRRILGPTHPSTLVSMNNLAATLLAESRYAEAQKLFEEVIEIKERTLGRDHSAMLLSINNLASILMNHGHLAQARKLFEEVIDRNRKRLGPDHQETLKSMGGLAWTLVVSADPKLRDPARGIQLAKEVAEKAPKDGNNWNTLGVAYYRAGDWKKALTALETSAELRGGGDSFDWFFLAMTHWQLGHKDEARRWYDRAVAWMEKNRPQDQEFRQFRAEAAKLLEIQ